MMTKNYIVRNLQLSNGYLPVLSDESNCLISVKTYLSASDSNVRVAKVITGLKEYEIYAPLKISSELSIKLDDQYRELLKQISSERKTIDDELSSIYDKIIDIKKLSSLNIEYISQDVFKAKIENNKISTGVNVIVYNEYNMYNDKITNLKDPIKDQDATTKRYFDENIQKKFDYIKNKFEELLKKINNNNSNQ